MPLILIARFFTSFASLFILAAAGYLAWTWYDGEWVRTVAAARLVGIRLVSGHSGPGKQYPRLTLDILKCRTARVDDRIAN